MWLRIICIKVTKHNASNQSVCCHIYFLINETETIYIYNRYIKHHLTSVLHLKSIIDLVFIYVLHIHIPFGLVWFFCIRCSFLFVYYWFVSLSFSSCIRFFRECDLLFCCFMIILFWLKVYPFVCENHRSINLCNFIYLICSFIWLHKCYWY